MAGERPPQGTPTDAPRRGDGRPVPKAINGGRLRPEKGGRGGSYHTDADCDRRSVQNEYNGRGSRDDS